MATKNLSKLRPGIRKRLTPEQRGETPSSGGSSRTPTTTEPTPQPSTSTSGSSSGGIDTTKTDGILKSLVEGSKENVAKVNEGIKQTAKIGEEAVKDVTHTAIAVTGASTAMAGAITVIGGSIGTTALSQLQTIGGTGLATGTAGSASKGVAGKIAVNTATVATTASLVKVAGYTVAAASLFVSSVGSYPFAGFIEEEALQTLGFASESAIKNGDWDNADKASALVKEILNPDTWDRILATIPYANILVELADFREAAAIKNAVDDKRIADGRIAEETGETEKERLKRNQEEEKADYRSNVDYYNAERKKLLIWEQDARREERDKDARFWASERKKQRKKEAEDRRAIAEFWELYRKSQQKIAEESRPSKLNFGIV